jgi:hypothetical protein
MRVPIRTAVALAAALFALPFSGAVRAATTPHAVADDPVSAGRFLVNFGGCNDCHTPHWNQLHDQIPEAARLTGNPEGFAGPWGTSYASNLRLMFAGMSEAEWLRRVRDPGQTHPPMPWWNLQALTVDDQRAIYAYIRGLGPAGERMPKYAPPAAR